MKKFKQLLGMILCSTLIAGSSIPVYATDEYGMPYVTATPIPEQHTEYYTQPADTDSHRRMASGTTDWSRSRGTDGYG